MRAAIVLAAGHSRRYGSANKLLTRYRDCPLLHHALAAACAAPVGRVIVATGRDWRVANCVRSFGNRRIDIVGPGRTNRRRDSLAAGLRRLRPNETEALVFLGDMPFVEPSMAWRLVRQAGCRAARPVWRGWPGHPVLLRDPRAALARIEQGRAPFDPSDVEIIGGNRLSGCDVDRPGMLRAAGILR